MPNRKRETPFPPPQRGKGKRSLLVYLPNILTLYRLSVAFPAAWFLYRGNFPLAVLLYLTAALSDYFDGYLARRLNARSSLGQLLDPVADKLLVLSYLLALYAAPFTYKPSKWLVLFLLLKEGVVILGSPLALKRGFLPEPNLAGKIATALLFTYGLLLLLANWGLPFIGKLLVAVEILTLLFLVGATLLYTLRGIKLLLKTP